MISDNRTATTASARHGGLYRLIWRWHFYAGLLCIPVILTLSVSGAIYLFKPQIDAYVESPYKTVAAGQQRSSANQQIRAALAAVPGSQFSAYRLPQSDQEAVVVSVMQGGTRKLVYVDPFSLRVLRTIAYEDQFIDQVRSLHGELLAGDAGAIVVELAGCWAIVLILTGVYLWWPRNAAGLAGVFYPRLAKKGRLLWRDLHAVIGFWLSAALLFLLISGLPWALVWGSAFKEVRSYFANAQQQDWSVSSVQAQRVWRQTAVANADLSPILVNNARSLRFAPPAELSVTDPERNLWQLVSDHQNRTLRAVAVLDGNTGEIVKVTPFAQRPWLDRAIGIGISIHEGHLFGWFNQVLGLVVAVGAFVIAASGLLMWWRRKPAGGLGAPKAMPDVRHSRVAAALLLILSLLLPLLAVSIVVLLLLDWLVLRHLLPLSSWLGAGRTA